MTAYFSLKEAADQLGVSKQLLRKWIADRKVAALAYKTPTGRHTYRLPKEAVETYRNLHATENQDIAATFDGIISQINQLHDKATDGLVQEALLKFMHAAYRARDVVLALTLSDQDCGCAGGTPCKR